MDIDGLGESSGSLEMRVGPWSLLLKMGKKTKAGSIVPGIHSSQGRSVFKETEPIVCTRDFSKKEELNGNLDLFWASVSGRWSAAEGGSQGS